MDLETEYRRTLSCLSAERSPAGQRHSELLECLGWVGGEYAPVEKRWGRGEGRGIEVLLATALYTVKAADATASDAAVANPGVPFTPPHMLLGAWLLWQTLSMGQGAPFCYLIGHFPLPIHCWVEGCLWCGQDSLGT